MSLLSRLVDLLRLGAASSLLAVAFVPYVAVGEQPYAAVGFIERVDALLDMQVIDGSWRVPPILALITSLSALVAIALPRRHRNRGHVCAAVLSLLAAAMAYRFTGQSVILHPLMGPKLLVLGGALWFGALAGDLGVKRLARPDVNRGLVPSGTPLTSGRCG